MAIKIKTIVAITRKIIYRANSTIQNQQIGNRYCLGTCAIADLRKYSTLMMNFTHNHRYYY
jgi:hypothetical protein